MSYPRFSFQRSVLFIDDQTKFENLIRNGLLGLNAQYEFCPSRVSSALERLEAETPDLIVSTLDFKEGNVLEFVGKNREFLAQVPSIYLSDPHTVDLEAELAKLGSFLVVERKRDPLELIRKMAQLIAESMDKPKPRLRLVSSQSEEQVKRHRQDAEVSSVNWAEEILKRTT
jgi:DNA-binding NtrC family response regulator